MSKESSDNKVGITIAIITSVTSIFIAIITGFFGLRAMQMQQESEATNIAMKIVATQSGATQASMATTMSAPTNTPYPMLTTPCPAGPLCEVFQQVDSGKSFSWAYPPDSFSYQFDGDCAHSGSYGIRLKFGFTPDFENGGWGVYWNSPFTTHFDASKFTALDFWVQGTTGNELFQIGLKDTTSQEIKIDSKDWIIPDDLKKGTIVTIPLSTFDGVAIASLNNVSFGFNKTSGSANICIDNIAFVRK